MAILSTPSGAFPVALVYITVGTLIDVWTIVALYFFPPQTAWGNFWTIGFLATGTALLVIGLLLGRIGRAARTAELPPAEVTHEVSDADLRAAENPPVIATTPVPPPTFAEPQPTQPAATRR
jgi:hypothetical protein